MFAASHRPKTLHFHLFKHRKIMDLLLLRQILYNMSRRFLQALFINCLLISALYASNLNAQQIKSVKEVSIN